MSTEFGWAHLLYRLYGDNDALLYIGRTNNMASRFAAHAKSQPWWDEVRRSAIETFPTFESLCDAEREAIISEGPRYNVIYSLSPYRRLVQDEPARWRGLSDRLDSVADMLHQRSCGLRPVPETSDDPTCDGCAETAWGCLTVADAAAGHHDPGLWAAARFLMREAREIGAWCEANTPAA